MAKSSLRGIVDIRVEEVAERLKDRHIKFEVDDDAKTLLADKGYDPVYGQLFISAVILYFRCILGARPLNRVIQHEVLNPLARLLLQGTVKQGDQAKVKTDNTKKELIVEKVNV